MQDFDKVLTYFKKLTTIPRGSTNCAGICAYLCDFAREKALRYRADDANNVVIFKPAGAGFESAAPIILQGHTDMVCAADEQSKIDFLHDALLLKEEGDYLFAEGSSLGADDGIAVAMMLALLDSDAPLPALTCIFTADEEIGMIGASALDMSDIEGKYLINVDSEDEGVLTVSCAGGSTAVLTLPVQTEKAAAHIYDITISGLAGGHSGMEIIKRGLNANKLVGALAAALPPEARLVKMRGGEKENAIAARAGLSVAFEKKADIGEVLARFEQSCAETEPNIKVSCVYRGFVSADMPTAKSAARMMRALGSMPQGIIKMSEFDPAAVQTSLNLGVMTQSEQKITFTFSVRSSVTAEREALETQLAAIADDNGGYLELSGIYPAWQYREHSVLRDTAMKVYESMFGSAPKIESIHAGLECGVLSAKKPELDCISLGPQLYDVHTAAERLCISSAARTWDYLKQLLSALG